MIECNFRRDVMRRWRKVEECGKDFLEYRSNETKSVGWNFMKADQRVVVCWFTMRRSKMELREKKKRNKTK